jgi:surfactin synthase thioesterase subunit
MQHTDTKLNRFYEELPTAVCLHTAGGSLESYRFLAKHLEGSFNVVGLEEPALYMDFKYEQLDTLVEFHFNRLKDRVNLNNCRIFGDCSGGPVAHAFATHLEENSYDVECCVYFNRITSWFDQTEGT